ncbi:hypothetical protein MMC27_003019 [Xylographa pallens]|nr:hypothetical protein [Xylographa pallens]
MPAELRHIILHHVPNTLSALNLVLADPAMEFLLHSFFPRIVAKSMPVELQNLVYVLLNIQRAGKVTGEVLEDLLEPLLDGRVLRRIWQPQTSVMDSKPDLTAIAYASRAIAYFAGTFASGVCQFPKATAQHQQDNYPVSFAAETHHIHLALWRFEVCCELSRSWLLPDGSSLRGSGNKALRLIPFLKRLIPLEIEDLHCIYDRF